MGEGQSDLLPDEIMEQHNVEGGKPNPGAGRRPEDKSGDTKSVDTKLNPGFDPKGQKQLAGYGQGRAYKKKSSVEVLEEMKQASQEAPEAIERQRVPKAAGDMMKGYFKNLGGQNDEAKPKKP